MITRMTIELVLQVFLLCSTFYRSLGFGLSRHQFGGILINNEPSLLTTTIRSRITPQPLRSSLDDELSSENFSVVIGKGSALNLDGDGSLTFQDSLLVDGSLAGNLKCLADSFEDTLVRVGIGGELLADIHCVAVVQVFGSVTGNIHCQQLIVGPGASIVGNIVSEKIHISEGSSIFGSLATGGFATKSIENDLAEPIIPSSKSEEQLNNSKDNTNTQSYAISANVYHDIVQKAALKQGRAAGLGVAKNGNRYDVEPRYDAVLDDFGNTFINKDQGKYVDSFGNPLIKPADDDQVASFREIRSLSSRTRTLLDTHKKKKEKELIRRKGSKSSEKDDIDNEIPTDEDSDGGQMPSFLR